MPCLTPSKRECATAVDWLAHAIIESMVKETFGNNFEILVAQTSKLGLLLIDSGLVLSFESAKLLWSGAWLLSFCVQKPCG